MRKFYEACFQYVVKKLPFDDVVLRHSRFANFPNRKDVSIKDVEYFIERCSTILKFGAPEFDSLHDEFISYQLLSDDDIPPQVIKEATVTPKLKDGKKEKHLCMDVIWGSLSQSKSSSEILKFPHLSQVAKLVLTLPHSNADEERVFSPVRKNKTDFRASLDLNRTLSSVITMKMNLDESSHQFKPSKNLLKKAKAATWNYNQLHDGKSKKDNYTQQTTSFSSSASTSIPTNPSALTKSYSKNAAAPKATCGNIASTAASTRGPVNSSDRASDETIPIPKPFGAPAFAFTGHTFVRQHKRKESKNKNTMTQTSLFSFQKPPTAFKIVDVPKQLEQEFLDIANKNSLKNIETYGIIGRKDARKKFTVTHLFIPKQQGTSDSCIAVDEDLTNNALQQNRCIVLGWIHRHPT